MPIKVLLTGVAGFSGSHVAEQILETTDWNIVGLDRYTYAGRMSNLAHLDPRRIKLVYHDFSECLDPLVAELGHVDYIVHLGAETHVKNSLTDAAPFVSSNILGTFNMLESAKWLKPRKFLYVSTDEVFGASEIPHMENDALTPSNPYAATKAAGEYLVRAWGQTYNVPYLITRTMNLFGRRQHKEKFVPMTIETIKHHGKVLIHTDAAGNSGSRQWLHASDQARALIFLLQSSAINEIFHVAGERRTNFEMANALADALEFTLWAEKQNAFEIYPGHDLHYAIDDSKIRKMGWQPRLSFDEGVRQTI